MTTKVRTFSPAMVQALLAGRKTQTRRLIKPDLVSEARFFGLERDGSWLFVKGCAYAKIKSPYAIGDRIYVREHWKTTPAYDDLSPSDMGGDEPLIYLADGATFNWAEADGDKFGRHRQAMHMPRWASRLWLEVTDVRVQRLQDISEADAIAESITCERMIVGAHCAGGHHSEIAANRFFSPHDLNDEEGFEDGADAYAALWNSLHTTEGERWEDNPWVVAVSFAVHHGNVDQGGAA